MITQEMIEKRLKQKLKIGNYSDFSKLFIDFVFAGGVGISNVQLIEYLKYLLSLAIKASDDLALAILEKLRRTYHAAEEDIENKKERYHMGNASRRANSEFCAFIYSMYFNIPNCRKGSGYNDIPKPIMQKTRFQILEYASQQWTQEMTDESYAAFRFLIEAFESQEKNEILNKILRPRVEKSFTKVESIEQWLSLCEKDPIPFEIQQLLVMARAKNGGPELAKHDIANSMAVKASK